MINIYTYRNNKEINQKNEIKEPKTENEVEELITFDFEDFFFFT